MNVYDPGLPYGLGLPVIHFSRESADNCSTDRIACVRVSWTKGDGMEGK